MASTDAARRSAPNPALYPDIEPYASGRLPLDSLHTMQWEACGNTNGMPIVFLHGGPGGGCLPHHRRFFDPDCWNIVLYDQRGAGRSTPPAALTDNTTQHLIADLERLREARGIERWVVFGGSWGSTLALAYAQAHPERVLGLVLRGIFLATPPELDWFMHGMRTIFPEAWRAFTQFLPEAERGDLLGAYHRRLTNSRSRDPPARRPCLGPLRGRVLDADAAGGAGARFDDAAASLAIARIEAHYFVHRAFLEPGQLLAGVPKIRHLPCTIVQGRYDIVCPPVTADALARAWPEAEYIVVPDAGHSVREPGIARELVAAVRRMLARVR